ncbi:tetratricopeptide repeat protein [Bacteroides eggerthii]|uniref:Tetratricopeptide repeat protein n=1 Tax=Bacteroides eggerthii TaxID=28111 RepID=A0ABT7U8G3_9BACE|nr:tetratricopeptide repeat protein [Bacteroides eggerthii]
MTNKTTHGHDMDHHLKSSEALIDKYKKPVMAGLAVVVVAVAGFFLYKSFILEPKNQKANEALFKGEQYFAMNDYDKALKGDSTGYKGFIYIAEEYSSTKAGNLARLYAGMSYAQSGNYQEAVKYLESYDECDDEMITPAAVGVLGNCYAQLNQLDKATETLLKAAEMADNTTLSPMYLQQAGEIFESQGNTDKALNCYKEIKNKYPQSMQAVEIDKYIERLSK